jgi:hypothetical protein
MNEIAHSKFVSITPATDWFFVHDGIPRTEPPIVWHIAAWGITDDGRVLGLIGAFGREQGGKHTPPRLIPVPPVPGDYLHRTQLNDIELQQLKKR